MVLMVTSMSLGMGQPLDAMQLLWISLLADITSSLALAAEPPEPDALGRWDKKVRGLSYLEQFLLIS
jgi:Ca2+-transporting ATPase